MPRGRKPKNVSVEQKIEAITAEIIKLESELTEKKNELDELQKELQNQKLAELMKKIEASGKSIDEFLAE